MSSSVSLHSDGSRSSVPDSLNKGTEFLPQSDTSGLSCANDAILSQNLYSTNTEILQDRDFQQIFSDSTDVGVGVQEDPEKKQMIKDAISGVEETKEILKENKREKELAITTLEFDDGKDIFGDHTCRRQPIKVKDMWILNHRIDEYTRKQWIYFDQYVENEKVDPLTLDTSQLAKFKQDKYERDSILIEKKRELAAPIQESLFAIYEKIENFPIFCSTVGEEYGVEFCEQFELMLLTDEAFLTMDLSEIKNMPSHKTQILMHRSLFIENKNQERVSDKAFIGEPSTLGELMDLRDVDLLLKWATVESFGYLLSVDQIALLLDQNPFLISQERFIRIILPLAATALGYTEQKLEKMANREELRPLLSQLPSSHIHLLPIEYFTSNHWHWNEERVSQVIGTRFPFLHKEREKIVRALSINTIIQCTNVWTYDHSDLFSDEQLCHLEVINQLHSIWTVKHLKCFPVKILQDASFPWDQFVESKGIGAILKERCEPHTTGATGEQKPASSSRLRGSGRKTANSRQETTPVKSVSIDSIHLPWSKLQKEEVVALFSGRLLETVVNIRVIQMIAQHLSVELHLQKMAHHFKHPEFPWSAFYQKSGFSEFLIQNPVWISYVPMVEFAEVSLQKFRSLFQCTNALQKDKIKERLRQIPEESRATLFNRGFLTAHHLAILD